MSVIKKWIRIGEEEIIKSVKMADIGSRFSILDRIEKDSVTDGISDVILGYSLVMALGKSRK